MGKREAEENEIAWVYDPELVLAEDGGLPGIRCPKCQWKPRAHDRWACSCLYEWNTFDTRGVCPACTRAWEHTQCLACKGWSLHEAWYVRASRAP